MELIAQHGWYFISLAIGSLVAGALAIFWYCRSRRENARLMSALNNMSEGLCMFDASARLILFNERYIEMYELSPEIARPGCSLRDLLEHRRRANTFEGDADAYIADARARMAGGETLQDVREIPGGRFMPYRAAPCRGAAGSPPTRISPSAAVRISTATGCWPMNNAGN